MVRSVLPVAAVLALAVVAGIYLSQTRSSGGAGSGDISQASSGGSCCPNSGPAVTQASLADGGSACSASPSGCPMAAAAAAKYCSEGEVCNSGETQCNAAEACPADGTKECSEDKEGEKKCCGTDGKCCKEKEPEKKCCGTDGKCCKESAASEGHDHDHDHDHESDKVAAKDAG